MKITIEIDTGKLSAKLCRDALGTELRGLAVQAVGRAKELAATNGFTAEVAVLVSIIPINRES